jgi:hypothetical protein
MGATSTVATSAPVGPVSSTTTVTREGPLEFVDGKFLGIAQGSLLTDAVSALGVAPVLLYDLDPPAFACTGTDAPWAIRSGGLTLVFEGSSEDTAFLTNWMYIGGSVAEFTEMVAPNDVRIGDARGKVEAAYPGFSDIGDEIAVSNPVYLRFAFENNMVNWFGIIDCVFEEIPLD